jgi:glucan phosphoethanolaminetransferase (alkaline phosphatase superfamily)
MKNSRIKTLTVCLTLLVTLIVGAFWSFVLYKYLSSASNHTSMNVSLMKWVASIGVCLCLVLFAFAIRKWAAVALLIFVLSLLGSYFIDRYNILVPYETWIERGMPVLGSRAVR